MSGRNYDRYPVYLERVYHKGFIIVFYPPQGDSYPYTIHEPMGNGQYLTRDHALCINDSIENEIERLKMIFDHKIWVRLKVAVDHIEHEKT